MSNWWQRAKALARVCATADVLLALQIACVAVGVRLLIRLPLDRLSALLEPSARRPMADAARESHILALVDLVLEVARPLLTADCLVRGITRYYVLRRAGVPVALAFGLGRPAGDVAGHCWLVKAGEPYLETRDPRSVFAELYRLEGAPVSAGSAC